MTREDFQELYDNECRIADWLIVALCVSMLVNLVLTLTLVGR